MSKNDFPISRPIADGGVLVEFGDIIDDEIHAQVLNFDALVRSANILGVTECVPSTTCVLVAYDPLQTSFDEVNDRIQPFLSSDHRDTINPSHWQIPTCYAHTLAPDLDTAAEQLNLDTQTIIEQHCAGQYKVYMYGFAPGYAYMGGVPEAIQLPRKPAPVMNVPAQTVMIAGPQCLITTLAMPTGWWRIGMTNFKPLNMEKDNPFILNVGDTVEFVAMSEAEFMRHSEQ